MENTRPSPAEQDAAQGARLLRSWRRLATRPGGRWLFSRLVGRMAPYTGTIGARVLELAPGRAVVRLRDRRAVRNHLRSVHAIALANLGELASGLAVMAGLPAGIRGIPREITIRYLKKARGTLVAHGSAVLPEVTDRADGEGRAEIRNEANELVAEVRVAWELERV
ncbi:MAG TPA: hotdog fold domain-containing protein [Longimicrobiales bacterium]|nr:hotdog fold domain-containing protein [Longimicrobiales bacterium]